MAQSGVKRGRRGRVALTTTQSACLAAALLCVHAADAAEHAIDTRGSRWVPTVLFIASGDSIVFRGMAGHETELIEGMGPEAAPPWRSELDAEDFTVTLEQPGAYIYKCHIHMNAGMVGAIVVGEGTPDNLSAIKDAIADVAPGRAVVQRVVGRLERELRRRGMP